MNIRFLNCIACAGMLAVALSGCVSDPYDEAAAEAARQEEISKNMASVFGVTFSASQDWSSTQSGSVTIVANADMDDIVKVQVLSCSPFGGSDANGAVVLNEAKVSKGQTVTLAYDAPSYRNRIYAACVASDGTYRIKGFEPQAKTTVSFAAATAQKAQSRAAATRALPENVTLGRTEASYSSQRASDASNSAFALWANDGWEGETLYQLADKDETPQRIYVDDFTDDERADIADIVATYLPNAQWVNGRRINNNREKIVNSDIVRLENNYITTTGEEPITVAPIYQNGGNEINNCHLYYYYYKPEQIAGMTEAEQVEFFKQLPKYKAVQLWRVFNPNQEVSYLPKATVKRVQAFTLLYWGDGTPTLNQTVGQYVFPAGYKIGMMLRSIQGDRSASRTDNGCLYGDGRLNVAINQYGSFANANLEPADPRIAIFGANGKTYMCFEDGTDQDFNDLILEMDGGVVPFGQQPELDKNVYTFCFEDRDAGDYDLNDIVIKAQRIDQTHVKYSLEACGANDELYLRNINGVLFNDNTEVHQYFGVSQNQFVNVSVSDEMGVVQEVVTVDASFSFADAACQPYIYNKTMGREVRIATAGEDPHGLMIPFDFCYPVECTCIKDAYTLFNNWGQGDVMATDWYLYPTEGKVVTRSGF